MHDMTIEPVKVAPLQRRRFVAAAVFAWLETQPMLIQAAAAHPTPKWYAVAEEMRQLALSWGDQPYGAVLVAANGFAAPGPSRVVKDGDPDAHAERVAIREAQRQLGKGDLSGAVLYSTSRPCRVCEQAAARANVLRMYFGPDMQDAGPPRP